MKNDSPQPMRAEKQHRLVWPTMPPPDDRLQPDHHRAPPPALSS